ncbi:heparinase II/III family protein [Vibrio sp. DNB22_19_2]
MNFSSPLRFYNTVKYLKSVQILNRILRKFKTVNLLHFPNEIREVDRKWNSYALCDSCYEGDLRFNFLNLSDVVSDWNDDSKPKLWLYNLHYFNDLNYTNWNSRTEVHTFLIDDWVEKNQPIFGNGWEPYPISLRSVNWIKWFLSGNSPKNSWLLSLSLQMQALEQQLEYHLLGNHLFANAKALMFAGCFFKGELADEWLKRGLSILAKEIPEQILADGGNFELTPMYHNIILADMLDLYQLSLLYPELIPQSTQAYWCKTIEKMFVWAEHMQHPDGDVSFFNDSAMGIAPTLTALRLYAEQLNFNLSSPTTDTTKVFHLKASGYVVIKDQTNKLIIDVAKIGPDYIPGHAHADTLSFELSIDNDRVFVNSGTSVYGSGLERLRQRKTESHNTVVVDNQDSSEVWSGFRVARRAHTSKPIITEGEQTVTVECSHDGYTRLPGKVTHSRKWQLAPDRLLICDQLFGAFSRAEAHYHLHPDVRVEGPNKSNQVILHLPSGTQYNVRADGAVVKVLDATWHPEFGLSTVNKKLVLNFEHNEVNFVITRA